MKKTNVKMNKPTYLGFSILHLSKITMYEFCYDCIKPKYDKKVKLCYKDTGRFIIHIKTKDCYKDIPDDIERRFDTSNYEVDRPLPKIKNKKVIGLMKDELGGKIMIKLVALRIKTYSYLMDNDSEAKKEKGTKKCVIKRMLKFPDYKDCLSNKEIILKSQQRFKSERHNVYTEKINKITLSSNDDKILQTYDRITSYLYGTSAGKVCKIEMLSKVNINKYKYKYNFDDYTNENKAEHNLKWLYIPDHPYRTLIIGGSGSAKTNALLNLTNNRPDIDKIYLYAKDPCEAKHQYLINKLEKVGLNHYDDPKAFMEYSNDMQEVYKNIEDYNPDKKRKVFIVFNDMIADMINKKKLNPVVKQLFTRDRKRNISIVFITQSYFKVPKDIRLNSTLFFIMKIPN